MRRLILALLSASMIATASAQMIGPEIPLAPAATGIGPANGFIPRVAATGSGYLAVWQDHGGATGARLDSHGNLLDPVNLRFGGQRLFGPAAVSASGADALVAINQCFAITLTRVSAEGVVGAPRTIVNNM